MPHWFYNRPLDRADPTEAKVAEVFNALPEGWYIRWGYFYERKSARGLRDKEGDFLLLGPDGRILVVEVKGGQNRHFVLTGEWEHGDDNPATQLFGEWKAVMDALREAYDGTIPYVGKALCLPHVNLTEQDRLCGELERECLIFRQDLEDFEGWWANYMLKHGTYCPDPVKAFQVGLAKGLKPASMQLFLKQSDRLFDQFKATEFEILAMLAENDHWMVEGGVGTGKTFLALKQAEWLASEGAGRRVLFLVYNLLLAERLKKMAAKLKLPRGEVVVLSWEELLGQIIAKEGVQMEIPSDPEALRSYFQEELPGYVQMALAGGQVVPEYDALVVDEAQDHDTRVETDPKASGLGWWSWYLALLKDGPASPIAIFYDQAQRPAFRGEDNFQPEVLRMSLGGAVHVRMRRALRYTQPIFNYLKALRAEGTRHLVDAIDAHADLPTGPKVVQATVRSGETTASTVEAILQDWKAKGLCRPDEVALIGPRKWLKSSSIGEGTTLCGFEVADYDEDIRGQITYLGAHRSKGMDFLAVILIDFASFKDLAEDESKEGYQEAYFIGASRARQLLGVVNS